MKVGTNSDIYNLWTKPCHCEIRILRKGQSENWDLIPREYEIKMTPDCALPVFIDTKWQLAHHA